MNEEPVSDAPRAPLSVLVIGAGKVGSALARALREAGVEVSLRSGRAGLPEARIDVDAIILAVRDRFLGDVAGELAARGLVGHAPVCVFHCAGALSSEVLAPARRAGPLVSVAQLHPMISFADLSFAPTLARGQLHVEGDAPAVELGTQLGRRLGMSPRTVAGLAPVAYHAAAGLVANGAAALAAGGVELLARAGVPRSVAPLMLGPLLRSVAENVEALGLPSALTGPVRRGEALSVARHLATLATLAPELVPLYVACARVQLPLARALGEADDEALAAVARALDEAAPASAPAGTG